MTDIETEERFIALEMFVADFDRTLKDLNRIVAEQALTIDRLEKEVRDLELHGAGEFVRPLSEEVPPPNKKKKNCIFRCKKPSKKCIFPPLLYQNKRRLS